MTMKRDYVHASLSPLGRLTLSCDGEALTGLWFEGQKHFGDTLGEHREEKDLPVFAQADRWLDLYFSGRIPDFTPPLSMRGTVFRQAVWEQLLLIPYGQTITYGALARRLMEEKGDSRVSAQAVGGAVGHNPVSLIVPCHRVVGANGTLTGYAGGLEKKFWLLTMERATAEKDKT